MAISTVDDIAAGLAADQRDLFFKTFAAPKAAGAYVSGWTAVGFPPAGAAPPAYTAGSGYAPSRTTTGAINYVNGAVQNWIARMSASSTRVGTIILADRLWACTGMGFAAATYTVTTPGSLPARITDNGLNCELIQENYAVAGAASGTLTANYLDSSNGSVSGVIPAVVSAPASGQVQFIPLANNLGVKQLTSIVTSATWTSGTSWGASIIKRICEVPIIAIAGGGVLDWASLPIQKLPSDCCLMLIYGPADGTTAPVVIGAVNVIDK